MEASKILADIANRPGVRLFLDAGALLKRMPKWLAVLVVLFELWIHGYGIINYKGFIVFVKDIARLLLEIVK